MSPPNPSTITLLVLLPLLGWRIYARFKRMVGRQRLSRVRPWITLVIFPMLILFLGLAAISHPERLWVLVAGLGVGAGLGVFGLGKTKFEPTREGLFYTPNAHLGIALSLLFAGRVVYRLVEVFVLAPHLPHNSADFVRSPLTLGVFGLLAGYYVTYAVGLVRWRFRVLAAKRRREAGQTNASPAMKIEIDDLSRPEIHALLNEHLQNMYELSPPESVHALDLDKLRKPGITFWSAWEGPVLVGVGALKELDAKHGEVKSMRTPAALRRKGAGRAILAHIIDVARSRSYERLSLETGSADAFKPAQSLYESSGFTRCGKFGDYEDDPNSVFMTKRL